MSPELAFFARSDLPDIDDHVVEPGGGYELLDGELVAVPPAEEPHGTRHSQVGALVELHVDVEFEVALDLLIRTSWRDNFAPDVSVFPQARRPGTDKRQLEQLVFEVVSTQTLADAARKAAKLVGRGVRRVFAIDVERSRALEWSAADDAWRVLDPGGEIVDPALQVPVPIRALIHAARIDDPAARALIAKRNPVIEAVRAEDRAQGRAEGKAEGRAEGLAEGLGAGYARAVLALLGIRGVAISGVERARIVAERDPARLERWLARAAHCASVAEILADG